MPVTRNEPASLIQNTMYRRMFVARINDVIAVKGSANRLTELSDNLIGIKGIIHGKLVMSRTE